MTHICVSKVSIIGSDNRLSPGRCQAIIWTNAGILLIGPLWTNFNETSIKIHTFSFKKIHLKLSSGKWRPFCLGHNVLKGVLTWSKADYLNSPQRMSGTGLLSLYMHKQHDNELAMSGVSTSALYSTHILQDYLTGSGAITWLPHCQWSTVTRKNMSN